jgi:hypothetical protein
MGTDRLQKTIDAFEVLNGKLVDHTNGPIEDAILHLYWLFVEAKNGQGYTTTEANMLQDVIDRAFDPDL